MKTKERLIDNIVKEGKRTFARLIDEGYDQLEAMEILRDFISEKMEMNRKASANLVRLLAHMVAVDRGLEGYTQKEVDSIFLHGIRAIKDGGQS